jgi:hypothetical protein
MGWRKYNQMKKIKLKKKIIPLHRNVCQHPICFNSKVKPINFNIDSNDFIRIGRRGYKGFVYKDENTGYALGTHKVQSDSVKNILPTQFDTQFLMGLMFLLTKKRNEGENLYKLEFNSMYTMLKTLGLPTEKWYYERVKESLRKWRGIFLHYQNRFRKNTKGKYRIQTLNIPSILDSVSYEYNEGEKYQERSIKITFSVSFVELMEFSFYSPIDYDIIKKLPSPASINLYKFLISWDLHLKSGKFIKRNLKKFCFLELAMGEKTRTNKMKETLKASIIKVNTLLTKNQQFKIDFKDKNVIFKLS